MKKIICILILSFFVFSNAYAQDDGSVIDVLVLYTQNAEDAASSGINSEISEAINSANQIFLNSGVGQRLRLVHTEKINYIEMDCSSEGSTQFQLVFALNTISGNVTGYEFIAELRNTYSADIVSLFIDPGFYDCGLDEISSIKPVGKSDVPDSVSIENEAKAFSVLYRSRAVDPDFTFAHEITHTMGAHHDLIAAPMGLVNRAFDYSSGYLFDPDPNDTENIRFRTLMGGKNECIELNIAFEDCIRLPFISNPDLTYLGVPLGIPEGQENAANNTLTLNNVAPFIANYRYSSIPTTTISAIHPASKQEDEVAINILGSNFTPNMSVYFTRREENQVVRIPASFYYFNDTHVAALIPNESLNGPIEIVSENNSAASTAIFGSVNNDLDISGYYFDGEMLHIFGSGFSYEAVPGISFNNVTTSVLYIIDSTHLALHVPQDAVTGPISINTVNGSVSSKRFFVIN